MVPTDLSLVDHHCHGVVPASLDRTGFEDLISESAWPAPAETTHFDSPLGLAIRRWCAPVLDLDPGRSPEEYLARRAELGPEEVNRRFLRAADLEALLLETGYRRDDTLGVAEMGALADAPAHSVARLEAVAEEMAAGGVEPGEYPEAYGKAVDRAAADAVGLKTIVAYRAGFTFDPSPPSREAVIAAAQKWLSEPRKGHYRLEDPVLLRHGIWTGARLAAERGLPLQFHVGYGDPDVTLHMTNPSLLTDLLRAFHPLRVQVVLLHCYPYHREAAYLAAAFPYVSFDVGLAVTYTGPGFARVLAEALELSPFTKHLYSSDAFGLAELYYVGARAFRNALRDVLGSWVAGDYCSAEEADRIARLIASGNAHRLYPLETTRG